jgi:WD40 repeat protein/serine/threonine protein kinase
MIAVEDQARSIFLAAVERAADQWPAFLGQACGDNRELRARVEQLLQAHQAMGSIQAGAAPAATVDELPIREGPSTIIGPYKLLEQIGEGGFGVVFLAEQTEPVRRKVALKILKPGMDTHQVVARFEAERQALAIMDHPNIAKVFDGGATPTGRPYFVMELVKGVPITEFCDQNRLTPRQRLELFVPVCQAVQHAHQKGIIHRDLKPSNVLVSRHDTMPIVKVIDFGVAKALGQTLTDKTLFTGIAQMIGTPLYMSPEQAGMSDLDVDTRSDIYSLGVLLYELLTGTTPFTREHFKSAAYDEIRRIIREVEPPKPSTRLSDSKESLPSIAAQRQTEPAKLMKLLRGELDWIVLKALEKDRNRRYESANGFAADVQRYLADEPVQACPPTAAYRFRKFARRNRGALAIATVIAAALVTALIAFGAGESRAREALHDKATAEGERADKEAERATAEGKRADEATLRLKAEKERADALEREKKALEKWRQTAHYLKTAVAFSEYRANNVARADQALDECDTDLRNWEWHYLKRLCHSELSSVPLARNIGSNLKQVAFSPNLSRLAQADGQELRIFDTATGKEVQILKGSPRTIQGVWFSPDGKQLAAAGSDFKAKGVRIWDIETGKEVAVLKGQTLAEGLYSAAFSLDGKRVAGTDRMGNLFLWDAATGELQRHVEAHTLVNGRHGGDTTVAFHPDGSWLATACAYDGVVKIWDANKGTLLRSLGQGDGFAQVVVSPKGTWVAAASSIRAQDSDPSVRLWDAKTGQTRRVFRHARRATCLAFSPDEKQLAVGSEDTTLTIWDIQTGLEFATYRGHTRAISAVAFSADGRQVHSLGDDRLVKTWDATRPPEARVLKEGRGANHATLSADGRLVAAAVYSDVYVWDADTGKQLQKFIPEDGAAKMVAFSPDGALVAAAASCGPWVSSGYVKVWDVKSGKLVHTLPDPAREPGPASAAVAFSPDGKRLASGGLDRAVRIWDVATGKELFRLPGHTRTVSGLGFSRDGSRLVSATGGWMFEFVGVDPGPLKLKSDRYDLIPDLKVWDLTTNKEILNLSLKDKKVGVAISPNGELVAAAFEDRSVRIYSVATGKEVHVLKGHSGGVLGIAFSPDGKRLVSSGGADESVKLWDAQTGEEIITLVRGSTDLIRNVAFSADGRRIVASGKDDVRVWDATPLPKK